MNESVKPFEGSTYFVSSRGILKNCAHHNALPVSSTSSIDATLLQGFRANASVYVCADAIESFVEHHLARIDSQFVLVTGDSDRPITKELVGQRSLEILLSNPYLIRWYAQNLAFRHQLIEQIPIGMDYHTAWERPGAWGLMRQSAFTQETSLIKALAAAPPTERRHLSCYSNWHFDLSRGDRKECVSKVDSSICFYEPARIPRFATWQRSAQFMYVLSPSGYGYDCHRTWETIILGSIPIVKRSQFSVIYDDLPVLIVDDWSEVTHAKLLESARVLLPKKYNYAKCLREYWARLINQLDTRAHDLFLTMHEFRRLYSQFEG